LRALRARASEKVVSGLGNFLRQIGEFLFPTGEAKPGK